MCSYAANPRRVRSSPPAPRHPPRYLYPPTLPGGGGGHNSAAICRSATPRPTPPCLPRLRVAGEPAGPVGCQLLNSPPRPHTSLGPPTWASVAKGDVLTCVEKTTCPGPAVTAAEFSALYERCLASGLKARLVVSHAAGCQAIMVSCSIPVLAVTATAAGRRHHRRCHRH
jgi:hypothetical protein